jgi:hypothetical protein
MHDLEKTLAEGTVPFLEKAARLTEARQMDGSRFSAWLLQALAQTRAWTHR